jgi:hypothetical protein
MSQKRSGPTVSGRTTSKTTTPECSRDTDAQHAVDLSLIGTEGDLWARIFSGEFRLARRCEVCGRWLTSGASKAVGRGPVCSARAVNR